MSTFKLNLVNKEQLYLLCLTHFIYHMRLYIAQWGWTPSRLKTDSVTGDNSSERTNFRSYDTSRLQAAVAISILIDVFLTLWSGQTQSCSLPRLYILAGLSYRMFLHLVTWRLILGSFRLSGSTSEFRLSFQAFCIRKFGGVALGDTQQIQTTLVFGDSQIGVCVENGRTSLPQSRYDWMEIRYRML